MYCNHYRKTTAYSMYQLQFCNFNHSEHHAQIGNEPGNISLEIFQRIHVRHITIYAGEQRVENPTDININCWILCFEFEDSIAFQRKQKKEYERRVRSENNSTSRPVHQC